MRQRAEHSKLAELRAKTDRQILALVTRRLEAAIEAAEQRGDSLNAAGVYEESCRWLALVRGASQNELRQVERKLERLLELAPRKMRACCA